MPTKGLAWQFVPNMTPEKPYDVRVLGGKDEKMLDIWPGRTTVDVYYWTATRVVKDEFKLKEDFAPQFVLVLGAQQDALCINIPDDCPGYIALELKKWDKDKFVDGVTRISVYTIQFYDPVVLPLVKKAIRNANAQATPEELKKENK